MGDSKKGMDRRTFLKELSVGVGAVSAGSVLKTSAQQSSAQKKSLRSEFDFVIAGGGHNSLICASYLAKAGYKSVVLDAKEVAGGNTATEELTIPGYKHEPCAHTPSGLALGPIPKEVGLFDYGLEFTKQDELSSSYQFGDGAHINFWTGDLDRTMDEIARFSKRDARKLRKMLLEMRPFVAELMKYRSTPIGYGPSLEERIQTLPNGGIWARRAKAPMIYTISQIARDPHVQAMLYFMGVAFRHGPLEAGGGMDPLYMVNLALYSGWISAVGGTGAIPKAITAMLEDHDCAVLTNKYVIDLIIENGKCVGVKTSDGESYRGKYGVVSTLHPKQLIRMVPDKLGDAFVTSVKEYETSTPLSLFCIHLALKEPPLWNVNGKRRPVTQVGTVEDVDTHLRQTVTANLGSIDYDAMPTLRVMTPTFLDPGRTPDNGHTVKIESQQPYDLADGGPAKWDEIKHDYAEFHLQHLRRFAPNVTDDNILGMHVHSPLDIAGRNLNNMGGNCWGGREIESQIGAYRPVLGWASHHTPIKGLYMTGSSTHPGGAVTGVPGKNAATVILKDLGRSINEVVSKGPNKVTVS